VTELVVALGNFADAPKNRQVLRWKSGIVHLVRFMMLSIDAGGGGGVISRLKLAMNLLNALSATTCVKQ
jgi:hypothetical protein